MDKHTPSSNISRGWAILSLILLVPTTTASAQIERISWADLPARVEGQLVPVETLKLSDWPAATARAEMAPSCTVAQYIENTFYQWDEYEVQHADETDGLCLRMVHPQPGDLTVGEAQVLLSASRLWMGEQALSPFAETLDPSDPLLDGVPATPPDANDATPRTVLGTDDRVRVTNTTVYPWNTISYVAVSFPNGDNTRGTGFLVSPYTMMTNGHIVFNASRGGYANNIEVSPGQLQETNGGLVTRPYGSQTAIEWITNSGYENTEEAQFDYAAIFLATPFTEITTYMPLVFNNEPSGIINIAGYPGEAHEAPTLAMWRSAGNVVTVENRTLWYLADSSPGNSGGPAWLFSESLGRRVVAIHARSGSTSNGGPRLVSQNQTLITNWMNFDPVPPKVDSTSPCDGCSFAIASQIVVDFDEGINTDEIQPADVAVVLNGVALDGSISWSNGNTRMTWTPDSPFDPGTYTVTLFGENDTDFQDDSGNILDGDGDGDEGGNYTFQFTLQLGGDDQYESNDSFDDAATLGPGSYNLRGFDQDNFKIETVEGTLSVEVVGPEGNLDLQFWYRVDDEWMQMGSTRADSNESLEQEVPAGTHFIRVEPVNGLTSAYTLIITFVERAYPDLVVDSISPSAFSLDADESISVSIRIRNAGDGDAGALRVHLNNDCGDGFRTIDQLLAGNGATVTFSSISFGGPGTAQLEFGVDPCGLVQESNDGNNTRSVTITIREPAPAAPPCNDGFCGNCPPMSMMALAVGLIGLTHGRRKRRIRA